MSWHRRLEKPLPKRSKAFEKAVKSRGFAAVARVAAEMYRPHLATLLLNHEPRSQAQVKVLVQLSKAKPAWMHDAP